jgi:hypothetical protein
MPTPHLGQHLAAAAGSGEIGCFIMSYRIGKFDAELGSDASFPFESSRRIHEEYFNGPQSFQLSILKIPKTTHK